MRHSPAKFLFDAKQATALINEFVAGKSLADYSSSYLLAISNHLIIGLRDCFVALLLAMTNCGAFVVIAALRPAQGKLREAISP